MKSMVKINPGVCGLKTEVIADANNGQHVNFNILSDCVKVSKLAELLKKNEPFYAYEEIDPRSQSKILELARQELKGCCEACVVPISLFKSMQISAGLALPRDVAIHIVK